MKHSEFNPAFDNGQIVWLKANNEVSGMVTGIMVLPGGSIEYWVSWGSDFERRPHFECELSEDRPLSFGNDT